MRTQKYAVKLTAEARSAVERLARSYKRSARERLHARILLRADDAAEGGGATDAAIATELRTCVATAGRVRRHCVKEGWQAAVFRRPQAHRKARVLDGAGEAQLIALACGAPPEGYKRWSLRLLRERLIELQIVDTVSSETVRQTLKKTRSSHG